MNKYSQKINDVRLKDSVTMHNGRLMIGEDTK